MSVHNTSSNSSSPTSRWRLWVDGCGGYLLHSGNQWTVGSIDPQSPADICVRADWPRHAGVIHRKGTDYFWHSSQSDTNPVLIQSGHNLPISGSAQMTLNCPNPLSGSATLSLQNPHRFDGHVDGVVLVNNTLLIGPTSDCHIRATEFADRAVLVLRDGVWQGKLNDEDSFMTLTPGRRVSLASLVMTLEPA